MNDQRPVEKSRHDQRKPYYTKGRRLDDAAFAEVLQLLAGHSMARDWLIENLHVLQDHFGALFARHLRALSEAMNLSQAEIYEVASFYDHFDIVKEGENAPAPVTIRICDSLSCMLAGAEQLIAAVEEGVDPNQVRVMRAPCIGRCDSAPAARVGNREIDHANVEDLLALAKSAKCNADLPALIPPYINLNRYREAEGYKALQKVVSGKINFDEMLALLQQASLRGLGGAGFPTGNKWKIVKSFAGPRLMTINGDEGEPGTFKDRFYLETDPHRMLEGALIAAHFVEAERIYLYMRGEYATVLEILRTEIAALEAAKIIQPGFIELRRGAGAYICGEESAMLESIEGKRGIPRHRPPYIAQVGLFGRPTLNHNVETLWWVRDIIVKGPQWFADKGKEGFPGIRSWSVSGRVNNPGVKMAPAGVTVRELIDEYCDGMADGHVFKAYYPGGASGGVLPASLDNIPLDFGGKLAEYGAFVGSHAVVILSDQDNIRDAVSNTMAFFAHESCGQCTPCRGGTQKLAAMLASDQALDEETIRDIEAVMRDASICGLGQAAPNPLAHLLQYFREDL